MFPPVGSPASQPLPPLPDLSARQGGQGQGQDQSDPMAAILSGIAPIKAAVDSINMACKQVVQSGAIPGSEQVCGQIVALANSLLPMAAQQAMQPGPGQPGPGQPGPGSVPPVGAGGSQ